MDGITGTHLVTEVAQVDRYDSAADRYILTPLTDAVTLTRVGR